MKTFRCENKYDGNDYKDIRAETYEDAIVEALELLGYDLLTIEEDEEE